MARWAAYATLNTCGWGCCVNGHKAFSGQKFISKTIEITLLLFDYYRRSLRMQLTFRSKSSFYGIVKFTANHFLLWQIATQANFGHFWHSICVESFSTFSEHFGKIFINFNGVSQSNQNSANKLRRTHFVLDESEYLMLIKLTSGPNMPFPLNELLILHLFNSH